MKSPQTLSRRSLALLGLLASLGLGAPALAQEFPSKTITLVVPFSAGGAWTSWPGCWPKNCA